jgi:putative radical SAM-modified peptide
MDAEQRELEVLDEGQENTGEVYACCTGGTTNARS